MYGSSLTIAIFRPRASRIAPNEADAMPLPSEDTTPPVTNTKRVICLQGFPSQKEPGHEGRMNDGQASYHIAAAAATRVPSHPGRLPPADDARPPTDECAARNRRMRGPQPANARCGG